MKFFKKPQFIILSLVVLVSFFVAPNSWAAMGPVTNFVLQVIGTVLSWIIALLGHLITLIITGIIYVAQYNDFIYSPAVVNGWVMVRDVCNMFFILIVLVIAFATILRIEKFSVKQLLKKVILAAILINFSKTICGLLIDAASVVMMTFVNGFKDMGGPGITQILGIDKMLQITGLGSDSLQGQAVLSGAQAGLDKSRAVEFWDVILGYSLALVYMLVALVTLLAMFGTLVVRMIFLWIYIIISPLAYIASILPSTNSMSSKWWSNFTSYVMTGPLLAFFIWLSLSTLMSISSSNPMNVSYTMMGAKVENGVTGSGITVIGSTDFLIGYVVAIGLLIGGLIVSKDYGGAIGGAAGAGFNGIKKGANWAKKTAMKPVKYAGKKGVQGAKAVGKGSLYLANRGAKGLDQALTGGRVSKTAGWVKDNANLTGLGKMWNASVHGVTGGYFLNGHARDITAAVAKNGKYKGEDNIVYKKSEEGTITAEGASIYKQDKEGHYEVDNNGNKIRKSEAELEKILPKIKVGNKLVAAELEPMTKIGANFNIGSRAAVMYTKSNAAKNKKDAEEVDKFKDEYKDLDENELLNHYNGTTNANRRRALVMAGADKGLTSDWFDADAKKYEKQRKEVEERDPYEATYFDEDNKKRLASLNSVDLTHEYEAQQFDTHSDVNNPADRQALAKKLAAQDEMKRQGFWDTYVESLGLVRGMDANALSRDMEAKHGKIINDNDERRQEDIEEINQRQTQDKQQQFDKSKDLFRNKPTLMKEYMERTVKHRPDMVYDQKNAVHKEAMKDLIKKGKMKMDDLKVNHLDPHSLAAINATFKEALGEERYGSAIDKIDKEGDKKFAGKIAEASLINAKNEERSAKSMTNESDKNKALRSAFAFRKDFLKLDGDIKKAFTKDGKLDENDVKRFASNATNKDMDQIDPTKMTPEIAKILASQMSAAKLKQLDRHNGNPEVVNAIAQGFAAINHKDAQEVQQTVDSGIKVDSNKVKMMKIIQDAISKLNLDVDVTNYPVLNQFIDRIDENSGAFTRDEDNNVTDRDASADLIYEMQNTWNLRSPNP